MKTAIVMLYGMVLPDRKEYTEYLKTVLTDIRNKSIEKVILCGGYTDPKRANKSEAGTVKDFMLTENPEFTNYVLEDKSINSNQNLEFATQHVTDYDEIFVYCDLIRKAKVIWIALYFLFDMKQNDILNEFTNFISGKDIYKDFNYKNMSIISFERGGRHFEETIGQTYASIMDVMSLFNKEVEKADLEQRKKDFGLK